METISALHNLPEEVQESLTSLLLMLECAFQSSVKKAMSKDLTIILQIWQKEPIGQMFKSHTNFLQEITKQRQPISAPGG